MKKQLNWIFGFMIFMIMAWCYGFFWYAEKIPGEVKDETTLTDAIVVLTGGKNRISVGLQLLHANKAPKLFVSGVHEHVTFDEFVRHSKGIKDKISLGYDASDTHENAIETREWAMKQKLKSIRLVTSAYHMRRSLFEFKRLLPDLKIVPHPVYSNNVKHDRWWTSLNTSLLILREYSKYLWLNLRYFPEKIGIPL